MKNSENIQVERAHEVLIFNMILGRNHDSKEENSRMDEAGMIWEIDNDFIGYKAGEAKVGLRQPLLYTLFLSHWMKRKAGVWDVPLSEKIIDKVLKLDETLLDREIDAKYIENHQKKDIIDQVKLNITMIKSKINELKEKNKKITFEELISSN